MCGFLSHAAAKGCSKCMKNFSGVVGNINYSGFDRSLWPPRTNITHRKNVEEIIKCNTKTSRAKRESDFGCRYSILLDLPYFDAPKMLALDPMHNLFLGTGKQMINIWIKKGLLNESNFGQVQCFIDNMVVPSDVGRIPRKIEIGFSGFKADQYKNWIILYSIPSLFDILPPDHLECWRHFVLACHVLCQNKLSHVQINLADAPLMQFCKRVERIYGEEAITPNMHMHGHLKEVILDYGPMQEFWLFSYERYNGILGHQPINNKHIEPQLMRQFLRDDTPYSFPYPDQFKEDFEPICKSISSTKCAGSIFDHDTILSSNDFKMATKYSRGVLTSDELDVLQQLFCKLHGPAASVIVNSIFFKYLTVTINGREFRASGKRTKVPSVVLASWDTQLYGMPPTPLPYATSVALNMRPVDVHYFMKVFFTLEDSTFSLLFAHASWFYPRPDCHAFGKPVELWCHKLHEPFGLHSFLPLDHLSCRAHGIKKFHDENLLVVVPLVE